MAGGTQQRPRREGGRPEPRHVAQGLVLSDLESGDHLSGMSVDNGSATTVQSSKVDRQGWSGSDYASSSSNEINEYISSFPPVLPAFTSSPSAGNAKRMTRRIAATISIVENSSHRSKSTPKYDGLSRSWSLSGGQRFGSSTSDNLDSTIGRQDEPSQLPHLSNLQVRDPVFYQQRAPSPVSSSTSSTSEVDDDSAIEEPRDGNIKHHTNGKGTLAGAEENLTRLAEHYARIRRRRTENSEIFGSLRNERIQLQDLRERRASAGRAFMAAAQAILRENSGLDSIFKKMEGSQSIYDQAEQRLEDLIDQLEHGQLELELEERRFYSEAARPDSVPSSPSESSAGDTDSRSTLRGISGDRPEDIHPLFEELLEAFRDLQLAKESWADLKMKRRALEAKLVPGDKINLRQDFGGFQRTKILLARHYKRMTDEEVEFLQEYDDQEKRATSDIELYSNKAKLLRKECLERGVMPRNSPFREEGFGFDPFFRDDIRLGDMPPSQGSAKPRTLAHDTFPVLLSNPVHLLEAFPQTPQQSLKMANSLPPSLPTRQKFIDDAAREEKIHSLIQDANPEDKSDYINRWLLHKLRLSALEAEILYSTFRVRLKIRDITQWQQDVLAFWTLDQAANLPVRQFQAVSETPGSALNDSRTGPSKPTRHVSDSGLDFIGSWDVDQAWP